MIRISPIRVIGPDNEQIGVIETPEALRMATEAGLDLVEVVSDARPPVCKIMDYGKYKYELSKKKEGKSASKAPELKEIRLGRSVKIDPHDVKIRIDQARRFLLEGHKVQIIQRFRGREIAHRHLGLDNLHHAFEELSDIAKVEMEPRLIGRQATLLLAPDRTKLEAIKRKQAAEQAQAEAEAESEAQKQAEAEQQAAQDRPSESSHADESSPDRNHDAPGDDSQAHTEQTDSKKKKKKSGDTRQSNPVDDEIDALLGEQ